ncbi:uncharacterized protein K02A2.6-like [Anopheles arabiensis]|uniref:uncharacterized protein K02A2.6-like n=1 Tax=Anopheles arabiensis TaxID=7173 RepID=UPI001AAD771F|nr:uncharacterized protein K02A2.6-like [Anopheles arabiensis]
MSVADYFDRLEWALQLNNIPKEKYADYARVHMGSVLNNAFKFLITPKNPEEIPYEELRQILQRHFDQAKNKFVESIKFRNIRQQKGETIAQFVQSQQNSDIDVVQSLHCINNMPSVNKKMLNVKINEGKYDSLFGRDWIAQFTNEINFRELFTSTVPVNVLSSIEPTREQAAQLSKLLEDFNNIFSDVPGMLVGPPAKVHLKPDTTPVFARARDVPLALRERYASEIDKKLASGFYEKVEVSEWASPTHIVIKKNGGIRITGNYKPTVNPKMIIDEHPIPKIEDIFNKMKGAALFCHLDVTDAYTHLPIDEDFRHILTLNTSTHGLIRPKRAVYGAANIPAIWQRRMETILQGLTNVVSFFDDVIVFAKDFEEMLAALNETLEQMRRNGLRLNRSKCIFATSSLECLGHRIDSHGLHKSDKHIKAIRDAPTPTTPEELQLFLGHVLFEMYCLPILLSGHKQQRRPTKT